METDGVGESPGLVEVLGGLELENDDSDSVLSEEEALVHIGISEGTSRYSGSSSSKRSSSEWCEERYDPMLLALLVLRLSDTVELKPLASAGLSDETTLLPPTASSTN